MGRTLGRRWGFPYFRVLAGGGSIDPVALALLLIAVAMAGLGLVTALTGTPELGVISELAGGRVLHVDPGSFAWGEGLRPGQLVLFVTSSDSPGGATTVVQVGGEEAGASERAAGARLRAMVPVAVAAGVLALLAVVAFPRHVRRASAIAAVAIVIGSVPLTVASSPEVEIPAEVLAVAAPVIWIVRRSPRVPASALLAALALGIVGWGGVWTSAPALYEQADAIRMATVVAACATLVALQADLPTLGSRIRSAGGIRAVDVLVLPIMLAVFALLSWLGAPALLALGVVALIVVPYPRLRRGILTALDRVFVADLRDEMRIEAAEAERARLARDLHDVPLQELAAVIRRLDGAPDTTADVWALRNVADHLRSVATELRSPVLDDLGLAPAVDYLAGQMALQAVPFRVEADLQNECDVASARRPPPSVEIAVFRIIQEALANAIRHSGGTRVRVSGHVAPDRIVLSVVDDGEGLHEDAVDHAIREGHMGTASMRQRARSIDAVLSFTNTKDGGLAVRVGWRA